MKFAENLFTVDLEQLYNLDQNLIYKFHFYHGDIKIARLFVDYKERSAYWYHLTDKTIDKDIKEIGIKFEPKTLSRIEVTSEIKAIPVNSHIITNNPLAKKMIILGAGASYDHTFNLNRNDKRLNNRLPLTNQLFNEAYLEILKEFPGAYDLSTEILNSPNLELFFQEKWSKVLEVHNLPLLKKLINAQFYIFCLFEQLSRENKNHQRSNYYNLVSMAHDYIIKRENEYIPIVTFNYDTLLEDSIKRVTEHKYNNIEDYINLSKSQIPVFKPHGSSNWIREFKQGFIDVNLLKNGFSVIEFSKYINSQNLNLSDINLHLDSHIKLRKDMDDLKVSAGFMPNLLLPYKDKDELILPYGHLSQLKYFLPQVEEVLIIGWKGTEMKFQELLKQYLHDKPLKITLVDPGEDAINEFAKNYMNIIPKFTFCNFTNGNNVKTFSNYIQFCRNGEEWNFFKD